MAVKYDFYPTPVPAGREKEVEYHARVVSLGTVETDRLAKDIHSRCSLTESDVRSALLELTHVVAERLRNGERVHLEGLGYFQMTLKCPSVKSTKEIRAESIAFKSVTFRPEIELKKELSTVSFERAAYKRHTKGYSDDRIETKLAAFFAGNEYLTRADFERECFCTRSAAVKNINRLLEEGKLLKKGYRNAPIYFPAPGCFGREQV